jgi:predicted small metal-binding protein
MMAAPSEAAVKQRIIGHMNKDHQDSVSEIPDLILTSARYLIEDFRSSDMQNTTPGHRGSHPEMPQSWTFRSANSRLPLARGTM